MPTALEITTLLKQRAAELGFAPVGACAAVEATGMSRLAEWLAAGYAGDMGYIAARQAAYAHPRHVLDGVRSLLVLGLAYRTAEARPAASGEGRVARYAWGSADYHDLIHERLRELQRTLLALSPQAKVRGVVDTAPLLEREFAQLAGLGWIGKNTLLLSREAGSYFFLAVLLTDVELAYDDPHAEDYCGSCRACIEACPTQAFPQPYVLDASRCISYLTIEHRDHVPLGLRQGMGEWLFGCDICQEVCPWNRFAPPSPVPELAPLPNANPLELRSLFELSDDDFRNHYRSTPLWRPKRRGLLRNAAIVLGNQRCHEALPALERGLADAEALVRAASAWALGELDTPQAFSALRQRGPVEPDPAVRNEITRALAGRSAQTAHES